MLCVWIKWPSKLCATKQAGWVTMANGRQEHAAWCCHTPNRFGTVNMKDNVNIKWSWCEGWAWRSLIVAIYRTRRLSWCRRRLPMSSSHHSHKNHQEAEETERITSIMVWERNAIYCSPTPIPEQAKKLKNWWRNEGKKRRNDVSAQMSFLGAQCWHSDILNSSTISKAIRHVTILSESLERASVLHQGRTLVILGLLSRLRSLLWLSLCPLSPQPMVPSSHLQHHDSYIPTLECY